MEQQKIIYGNVTLSQLTHFAVELCGKDALIQKGFVTDSELNDAYKEKGSYLKFRYTNKNSLFQRIYQFFSELEKEFEIPLHKTERKNSLDGKYFEEVELSNFHHFYSHIIWSFIIQICRTGPFENTQNNLSKKIIYGHLLIQPTPYFIEYIKSVSNTTFAEVINGFITEHNLKYEQIYNELAENINDNESDSLLNVRKALQKCKKENTNPTWKIFYPFLKAIHKKDKRFSFIFLNLYFYLNFKNAIEWLSFKKSDLQKLELFCKNHQKNDTENIIKGAIKFINENVDMQNLEDIKEKALYFDSLLNKNCRKNLRIFQNNINELRNELPHSFFFWEKWFCAKDYVCKYLDSGSLAHLENAVKWYGLAFENGKYFMGKSAEQFIHEAIAVSVYLDMKQNPAKARTRLQKTSDNNSDTKTPLDKTTKNFYDFGLAFDLLLNDMNDAYNLYYHCFQNFWNCFSPASECARNIQKEDLFRASGIETTDTPENEKVLKSRETLLKITDGKINNILPTTHNVAYTPISNAIFQGYFDIVELYLDKSKYPSLNLNIPSTNNCYPIHEIVTQYLRGNDKEKIKPLVLQILEKTDKKALFTRTNRQKISPLQTVIQSLDLDLNKRFLDKMFSTEKIPDDFIISADELSPLYFALMTKYLFNNPVEYAKKLNIGNINYKNLFEPGLSESEKESSHDSDISFIMKISKNLKNAVPKEIRDKRKEEIKKKTDEIVDLYIERTSNVDGFINFSMRDPIANNQGCTALLYACEWDDVKTCKLLVSAGANLRQEIGKSPDFTLPNGNMLFLPNNFIRRAIYFKAWNCLEWFLKDNKNIASEYMHKKEINMTWLVYFLLMLQNEIWRNPQKYLDVQNNINIFLPLFLEAGASLKEDTIFGTAERILSGR
ncbi:hypothetical protein [uncultured Treponema sp.]|uniref:hypothetical protein n=1 Tax=uncultured Treponema sp. TaxID=162155 RepID=UPI00260AC940|nr:hypothetical protein [uncultured Treponema sp.]